MQKSGNLKYYHIAEGDWSAPFRLEITDYQALLSSELTFFNKARILSVACLTALAGPLVLRTEVRCPESDARPIIVRHKSRLLKFGCTLYRAEEDFTLHPNGVDIFISGKEWTPPFFWQPTQLRESLGTTNSDGTETDYTWHWFGETWSMRNQHRTRGVQVLLRCPWAQAEFQLNRV